MYINKLTALLLAQHAQFLLAHEGYHTMLTTGKTDGLPRIQCSVFYDTIQEHDRQFDILTGLWHDGDSIKSNEYDGTKWIDYTIEYQQ